MLRPVPVFLLLCTSLAAAAPDEVPRADPRVVNLVNDAGRFQALHDEVHPHVLALGAEPDEDRRTLLAERLATTFGKSGIEVLVRYREPHLIPVFLRLTEAPEWYVRRLAVYALQRNVGLVALDRLLVLLDDENALVREIVAQTIAVLHEIAAKHKTSVSDDRESKRALKGMRGRKKADRLVLERRLASEENPFVRASLQASLEVLGRRRLLRIHTEPLRGEAPGRHVPRLEGGEVTAYGTGSSFAATGSGRLRPTSGWGYPVLLYPREVFQATSDTPLVPLPQKQGSFHYGHDCGWFLEGSGIYAVADGVVRWIRSGGDWGGLIVTEHMDEKKAHVTALNGHCGTWVFVAGGEAVQKGQLLGQMGLSFSAENGGHGAHDHFGMYEGPFSEGHCYGRGLKDRTSEGWLVPADFLTPRVDGETLAPESYR